jgi:hypothetical protein
VKKRGLVHKTGRVLLATLVSTSALAVAASVIAATPARADAQHCLTHLPTSATDYQAIAFSRDPTFGIGDMTSSVQLPDGRRFYTFGDTAYYGLNGDGSSGPMAGFGNNSAWVQSGGCFTLVYRSGPGSRSWVLPPQQDGSILWPGGSVVVGTRLYVFMQRILRNSTFGTSLGASVAEFDLPSLKLARLTPIPWIAQRVFGQGAVYDGGYIYAYASQARTCAFCFAGDLYVARVPESQIMVPGAWQYRAGSTWVGNRFAGTPILSAAVSNTDILPYGNGFLLITKTVSIIGPPVEAWWSPSPVGPWQDLGTVFSVPSPPPSLVPGDTYQHAYTYNPIVIPGVRLADHGFLLSYNVNTFDPAEAQRDGRLFGPRFASITVPQPPTVPPRVPSAPSPSPWTPTFAIDGAGNVRTVAGGVAFNEPSAVHAAVAFARTPTARGGWIAAADGGVFAYGDARFFGSMGGVRLNQPIVGMAATPTGLGYWLVARDGGVFSFGDARFYGSTGNIRLNRPILAMTASPTGNGYWFVASDGGIFSFGDAHFFGSTGGAPPGFPVSSMAATPDGRGYWLMTIVGQVFTFGDANYMGNAPLPLAALTIGLVAAPGGYRIVDRAGNVFVRAVTLGQTRIATSAPLVAAG